MARRKKDSFRKRARWFGKGSRSRKALLISLVSFFALILLGILGFYQFLNWLQGEGFRDILGKSICNRAQAEQVDIPSNLTINGDRVSIPSVHITRRDMVSSVGAKRISSEIDRGELMHRHLVLNKLTVEEMVLMLDASRAGEELPPVSKKSGGFWSRFTPEKTTLKAFECKDTDAALLVGDKTYALAGVSIFGTPQPKLGKEAWQINFENGRLRTPLYYLQDCSVKNATVLLDTKTGNLNECRIQLTPGELRVKGLYERDSKRWSTTLRANKANVGRLLLGDWKKRLTGELFGELELTGKGGEIATGKGAIALQQGLLEGLPILSDIGIGNNRPYRSIQLDKAECRINFPYTDLSHNIPAAWLFDQIDVRAKGGSLLVRGHVIIGTDKALGGTLHIGIPENIPDALGLDKELCSRLFTGTGEAGYHWLNMNLSGTLDNPQEDLSIRLSTLVGEILPSLATKAISTAGETFRSMLPGRKDGDSPAPQDDGEEIEEVEDTTPAPDVIDAPANIGKGLLKMIF